MGYVANEKKLVLPNVCLFHNYIYPHNILSNKAENIKQMSLLKVKHNMRFSFFFKIPYNQTPG